MDISEKKFDVLEDDRIKYILWQYKDVFARKDYDLGRKNLVPHTIENVGSKPRRCEVRPMNPP